MHQLIQPAAKKPPTAPKPTGNMGQKPSTMRRKDDLATNSVTIVEKNMGVKDKGGRNKIANDQKGPGTDKVRSNKDKPNW